VILNINLMEIFASNKTYNDTMKKNNV